MGTRKRAVKGRHAKGDESEVNGTVQQESHSLTDIFVTWQFMAFLTVLTLVTFSMTIMVTKLYLGHTPSFIRYFDPFSSDENDLNANSLPEEHCEDGKCSMPAKQPPYVKADITNMLDYRIRQELDDADKLFEKESYAEAKSSFTYILSRHPDSPRAVQGQALTLCALAEKQQSNSLLEECIEELSKFMDLPNVPKTLYLVGGRKLVERQQFRGWGMRSTKVMKKMIDLFPEEQGLLNELGVQYLMIGRVPEAKITFQQRLDQDPTDVHALAHMGFIVKTSDNRPDLAIPILIQALSADDPAVRDGRFYFHLGDALQRVGNVSQAHEWYEKGATFGLFRSKWQRSLYNVEHLESRPWWTQAETKQEKLIKALEDNWEVIRDEGLSNLDQSGSFRPEAENLREKGDWKQLTLYQQGRRVDAGCKVAPKTCAILESFTETTTCKRGQIKFSVMHPGVHVWPHCGPTNCRIRMHLGLTIPDGCRIRVTDDTRGWQEGKVIVFDDSFEHEVWHEGDRLRLVLIVDIWHPDLTTRHKAALSPI